MGCDIHSFAEVKKEGKWQKIKDKIFSEGTEPFGWRSYLVFALLAGVKNYDHCEPMSEPKGLPDDSEFLNSKLEKEMEFNYGYFNNGTAYTQKDYLEKDINYHSHSYLTLKELIDFDYNKKFWNRRISKQTGPNSWTGSAIAEDGEGEIISYRDNLFEGFFNEIEILKTLGSPEDVRIIFYFDN